MADPADTQEVQPPRPANSWILYRAHQSALIRQSNPRMLQSEVSKMVSTMWKSEGTSVRKHFEKLAEEAKAKHQRQYPDYRFAPRKKEDRLRAREKSVRGSRAKKAKTRDATPTDASTSSSASSSTTPAIPPAPSLPMPFLWPGIPQQYMLYPPEVQYTSPPISIAPSPPSGKTSQSPQSSRGPVASSSSSVPVEPCPTSEPQTLTNQYYTPALPSSHSSSLNAYAAQSFPPLLQLSAQSGQPSDIPRGQAPSSEYMVWNNDAKEEILEAVSLTVPITGMENYAELSTTNENGVFNMPTIDSSNIVVHPPGEFDVAVGAHAPTIGYNGAKYDHFEFQRQLAAFMRADAFPQVAASSSHDEFESLFHQPNSAEVESYNAVQQRQASGLTEDMMSYLNFDAIEGSTEYAATSLPVPATVTPGQTHIDNSHHAAVMAIFSQMTNTTTPTPTPTSAYVPPSGAIYSSTRRVGGSWKPPLATLGPFEETAHPWTYSLTD